MRIKITYIHVAYFVNNKYNLLFLDSKHSIEFTEFTHF